jgi:hypothetical protein
MSLDWRIGVAFLYVPRLFTVTRNACLLVSKKPVFVRYILILSSRPQLGLGLTDDVWHQCEACVYCVQQCACGCISFWIRTCRIMTWISFEPLRVYALHLVGEATGRSGFGSAVMCFCDDCKRLQCTTVHVWPRNEVSLGLVLCVLIRRLRWSRRVG